jgi:hypothetical protein
MPSFVTSNAPKPSSASLSEMRLPEDPPGTVAHTSDGRAIVIGFAVNPWELAPGTWAPAARIWGPR